MSLNLDLLEFHVREATQELDLLQDAIQYALEQSDMLFVFGKPDDGLLAVQWVRSIIQIKKLP